MELYDVRIVETTVQPGDISIYHSFCTPGWPAATGAGALCFRERSAAQRSVRRRACDANGRRFSASFPSFCTKYLIAALSSIHLRQPSPFCRHVHICAPLAVLGTGTAQHCGLVCREPGTGGARTGRIQRLCAVARHAPDSILGLCLRRGDCGFGRAAAAGRELTLYRCLPLHRLEILPGVSTLLCPPVL